MEKSVIELDYFIKIKCDEKFIKSVENEEIKQEYDNISQKMVKNRFSHISVKNEEI